MQTDFHKNSPLTLFYCGLEKCSPSHAFGPAIRMHYLLHYIISGNGRFYFDNKMYKLKAGQAFLIPPGKSAYYIADEKNPWNYCWIGFSGTECSNILEYCGLTNETPVITHFENDNFKKSLLKLINTFNNKNTNELSLIGDMYNCFSNIYKLEENKNIKDYENYYKKAITYIQNNFSYDIQIKDIASHIGIDRTYLYKLFIKKINISPQQYLISYRLNIASNLLTTTQMNVSEVARSCGFKDIPAFHKHFKKKFKITPSKFKKNFFILTSL